MLLANILITLTNERFGDVRPELLLFWRGFIPFLCLSPFVFTLDWPTSYWFYVFTIATAFISVYTDKVKFAAPSKFGAAVYSRLAPAAIWITFFGWFILSERYRSEALSDWSQVLLTFAAIAVSYFSTLRLRKQCHISWAAFKFVLPAVVLSGCVAILNKFAMEASGFWSGIILYAWIQSIIIPLLAVSKEIARGGTFTSYIEPQLMRVGFMIGGLFVALNITKNIAITGAANPAYVVLIGLSQPVWIMLWNILKGREDKSDKVAGFGLLLGIILLIISSQIL